MTGNIVDMRGEKIITPTYFNYEIYMKGDENNVIRTYGFLIANGAFYGIGRGPQGNVELVFAANADEVKYVLSTGEHRFGGKLDA